MSKRKIEKYMIKKAKMIIDEWAQKPIEGRQIELLKILKENGCLEYFNTNALMTAKLVLELSNRIDKLEKK